MGHLSELLDHWAMLRHATAGDGECGDAIFADESRARFLASALEIIRSRSAANGQLQKVIIAKRSSGGGGGKALAIKADEEIPSTAYKLAGIAGRSTEDLFGDGEW